MIILFFGPMEPWFHKKAMAAMFGALFLALALLFVGCEQPENPLPKGVETANLGAYLEALPSNTPDTPHTVRLAASTVIDTEDTDDLGVWARINNMVRDAEKYVSLDLSSCAAKENSLSGASNPAENKLNVVKDNEYLKGMILPKTLTNIGSYTFYQCAALTEVTIPGSVTSIDSYAFDGCTALTKVTFAAGSTIDSWNWSSSVSVVSPFPGDLRAKYVSEGGEGTYIRESGENAWTNMAAPPTGVTATVQSVNSILVSWDTVSWALSYKIYRVSISTGSVSNIGATPNDSLSSGSYTDTGLSANTTYYYKVSRVSAIGESRLSESVSAATKTPTVPVNLKTMALSSSRLLLSWDAVPTTNSYLVYRADSPEGTYETILQTARTSYIDIGLAADTPYYYKVSAMNGLVEGNLSEYISESTLQSGKRVDVGDTGPAGGILFYVDDTGFISGGVTYYYLEAAPADLPGTYQWGGSYYSCAAGTAVGEGAVNTKTLTAAGHGHEHPAARACEEYSYGGCDDWFLPSIDELNLMYTHLKQQGIGDFSNNQYWSSSVYDSDDGYALYWYFSYGSYNVAAKNSAYLVRAIRAF
ncbi:MAG: leucine-rich repeat protein [Treponema sp.]|jgi:hypothetical protein|nr:leucine-rich repeat protein [Treponema sp.]